MKELFEMSNAEIESVITLLYKTEKIRAILRDRICNGFTYSQLAQKYYLESDWWGRRDYEAFVSKVRCKVDRVIREIRKRAEKDGGRWTENETDNV